MRRIQFLVALTAALLVAPSLAAQARVGGSAGHGLGAGPAAVGVSAAGARSGVQVVTQGRGQAGISVLGRSGSRSARGAAAAVRPGVASIGPVAAIATEPGTPSIPSMGRPIPPLERGPAGTRIGAARRDSAIFDFNRTQGRFIRRGGFLASVPVVVVPYAYGGYAYADGDPNVVVIDRNTQTASAAENVVTVDPRPAAPAPEPKVIEVQPGQPEGTVETPAGDVPVYRGGSPQPVAEKPAIYLVAFKSGVIYTSREHWLEGETLHYVTMNGAHQTSPLNQVDLDFTRQLNAERNLPFVLEVRPAATN